MTFYIKQNDTSPAIEYQLQDDDGNAVDLTGFNQVEFHMTKEDVSGTVVDADTDGDVSVTKASEGKVKYEWNQGDTEQTGRHLAEWQVEYADGTVETFPNRRNIHVEIEEEIS